MLWFFITDLQVVFLDEIFFGFLAALHYFGYIIAVEIYKKKTKQEDWETHDARLLTEVKVLVGVKPTAFLCLPQIFHICLSLPSRSSTVYSPLLT